MTFPERFKRWFGYSRRERSGSLILCIILLLVIVLQFTGTRHNSDQVMDKENDKNQEKSEIGPINEASEDPDYVFFDPNTASRDLLLQIGLSDKQANTLINYRTSGGKFYKAEDFRKIYGIGRTKQDSIIPYIRIITEKADSRIQEAVDTGLSEIKAVKVFAAYPGPDIVFLNSGDSSDYEQLPGIGPVLSGRIIKYRSLLGGFTGIDQLNEVYGLSKEVIDLNRDNFALDTAEIAPILINIMPYSSLLRHPYINRNQVETIIQYRKLIGPLKSLDELVRNRVFTQSEIERIEPYISFIDSLRNIE